MKQSADDAHHDDRRPVTPERALTRPRDAASVDASCSGAQLVYPFAFRRETFDARAGAFDARQFAAEPEERPLWQSGRFPGQEMLPHIAGYFNPRDQTAATARLWCMDARALGLAEGAAPPEWHLRWHGQTIPFHLHEVRLFLFRGGIGFLTLGVRLATPRLADWHTFLHAARFATGWRGARLDPPRPAAGQPAPFLLDGLRGATADYARRANTEAVPVLMDAVTALLGADRLPDDDRPWWRAVFVEGQLLPYAVLYVDGLPEEARPLLLYQVRNFFHAAQALRPAPADLRPDEQPGLLPYAAGQWFFCSLDGGGFVACDAPPRDSPAAPEAFFRATLPDHLNQIYFLLFLLVQQQKFALIAQSEEVARHGLLETPADDDDDEQRARAFARIQAGLLSFTARGYFAQVTQQEHHHRFYRLCQEVLQVDRLHREVSDEVREIGSYLLLQRTARQNQLAEEAARRERRLARIGWLLGPPAVAIAFLGINLRGVTLSSDGLDLWAAFAIVLAAFVAGATVLALQQPRSPRQGLARLRRWLLAVATAPRRGLAELRGRRGR